MGQLGYAAAIHGAQGLTADTMHPLATGQESRQALCTMLTCGRQANHLSFRLSGTATGPAQPSTPFPPSCPLAASCPERLAHASCRSTPLGGAGSAVAGQVLGEGLTDEVRLAPSGFLRQVLELLLGGL